MSTEAIPQWTLADHLRKAREHAGLEQVELAERMGVARNTVSRYEQAISEPKWYVVRMWAEATGVPLEWFSGAPVVLRARRDSNPQPSDLCSAASLAVAA